MRARLKQAFGTLMLCAWLAACTPSVSVEPSDYSPAPSLLPSVTIPENTPQSTPEPTPDTALEPYDGEVLMLTVYPLLAFPEQSAGGYYGTLLDAACLTPTEFRLLLEELYTQDYILVDISALYELSESVKAQRKPIALPPGKKPLVLCLDDPTYDERYQNFGWYDRLTLDAHGQPVMAAYDEYAKPPADWPEGEPWEPAPMLGYDDVIPMVEAFCVEYPEFSHQHARGLLAVTGYEGLLGFHDIEQEAGDALSVIQALRELGWRFACHGYERLHTGKVTPERLAADTARWRDGIGALVGDSAVYVLSNTDSVSSGTAAQLHELGFSLILGGSMSDGAIVPRAAITGSSLRHGTETPLGDLSGLFQVSERLHDNPRAADLAGPYDITVMVGGDVYLQGWLGNYLLRGQYDKVIHPELARRFRLADVSMINLETSVSERGEPQPEKQYTYRAPPENLRFLRDHMGMDVVSLANNHTIDFGWDAFFDTLDHLDDYGIGRMGGGRGLDEALEPWVADVGGVTIAFFGGCQFAPNGDWYAKTNKAGLLMCYDTKMIGTAIAQAKEQYDYVVVYVHWGPERIMEPTERQMKTGRQMLDYGADAVIGSHPHIVQSFELYNGKPLIYSVGNFLFNDKTPQTVALSLHIDASGLTVEIEPCQIKGTYTYPAEGQARADMLRLWSDISPGLRFNELGVMTEDLLD